MPIHSIFRSLHSTSQASLVILCAIAWQASAAQTAAAASAASPANPGASVPAVSYRSVFKETSLGLEKGSTDWRKANDEVGKFTRGHIDILKWEEQENARAMKEGLGKPMAKPMEKPMAEPDATQKIAVPAKPDAAKPIAAPAHKH